MEGRGGWRVGVGWMEGKGRGGWKVEVDGG